MHATRYKSIAYAAGYKLFEKVSEMGLGLFHPF